MTQVSTIGLDLAKNVFQVHGIATDGTVVICRRLRRAEVVPFFSRLPPCLVGMEACATSHYWARELGELGHEVRMMPPRYVKPYVKRGKNDALDAEAICEAVQRPSMRFVPVKTAEQQGALVIHKTRDLLVRQRAILVNALRSHLAEFGEEYRGFRVWAMTMETEEVSHGTTQTACYPGRAARSVAGGDGCEDGVRQRWPA